MEAMQGKVEAMQDKVDMLQDELSHRRKVEMALATRTTASKSKFAIAASPKPMSE